MPSLQEISSAHFRIGTDPRQESPELWGPLRESLPAKLAMKVNYQDITYSTNFRFFDTQVLEHFVQAQQLSPLLAAEVARHGWMQFGHCQRNEHQQSPRSSSPGRALEQQEALLLLPYAELLFRSLEHLDPPFREPAYYLELVREKQKELAK